MEPLLSANSAPVRRLSPPTLYGFNLVTVLFLLLCPVIRAQINPPADLSPSPTPAPMLSAPVSAPTPAAQSPAATPSPSGTGTTSATPEGSSPVPSVNPPVPSAPEPTPWPAPVVATVPQKIVLPSEDTMPFVDFLTKHDAEVTAFFKKHEDEFKSALSNQAWSYFARIIGITALFFILFDITMSRVFAHFYAPSFATLVRCLFYSGGKIVIGVLSIGISLVVCFILIFIVGSLALAILPLLGVVLPIAATSWLVTQIYRTSAVTSTVFVIGSSALGCIGFFIVMTLFQVEQVKSAATSYITVTVLPALTSDTDNIKTQIDQANQQQLMLTNQKTALETHDIPELQAKIDRLTSQINAINVSDNTRLCQLAEIRSSGNLPAAIAGYNEFLTMYPNSPLTDSVRAQISEMNIELNAQLESKQETDALTKQQAAAADAALMARINSGHASLTEFLQKFHFQTREFVSNTLGPPNSIGPNQWAYDKMMVINPSTGTPSGVLFIFFDNKVQSVEYNNP